MTDCIKHLTDLGDQLFSKRQALLSYWQDVAENFLPTRADFTVQRSVGEEMMQGLMTSAPVITCRDLGNSFSAMLRPSQKEWFALTTGRPDQEDTDAKQWMERTAKLQKRAMYDRNSQFTRATKEGDMDFAAFGQCVISTELVSARPGEPRNQLLYRCWHIRDVAWMEGIGGKVTTIHRKWKPTAAELCEFFPGKVHQKVIDKLQKTPYDEVNVRHVVMPREAYENLSGAIKIKQPFVSIWFDCDNRHMLECVGSHTTIYTIPRWQTVSGSQYAHSPATVCALPDARLLQDVTRVLLEAGEKAVNPPMVAVREAIRSDVSVYAGGITYINAEYDERTGDPLRAIMNDKSGLGFGQDTAIDLRKQLADAFYLSKLNLPPAGGPDMTAYEVGQRVQEFIRNTLPLFEPMEMDYNGQLCDITFTTLMMASPEIRQSIPKSIAGQDINFTFQSPLREAVERVKVGQFMEASQVLAQAINLDPSVKYLIDGRKAGRDVIEAVVPAAWIRSMTDVEEMAAAEAAEQQTAQLMQMMQSGANISKTIGEAVPAGTMQ